jgi:hypothetical protein
MLCTATRPVVNVPVLSSRMKQPVAVHLPGEGSGPGVDKAY